MKVKLNDKSYDVVEGMRLDEFIESLDIQLQGIAIAIDYEVISRSRWGDISLEEGMKLMMIHAVSGG